MTQVITYGSGLDTGVFWACYVVSVTDPCVVFESYSPQGVHGDGTDAQVPTRKRVAAV